MNRYQLPNSAALDYSIASVRAGLSASQARKEFRARGETMPAWLPMVLTPGITADSEDDAVDTVLRAHPAAWRVSHEGVREPDTVVTMKADGRFHIAKMDDIGREVDEVSRQMWNLYVGK